MSGSGRSMPNDENPDSSLIDQDVGYVFYPKKYPHAPGHPRLDIFLRKIPTKHPFDPEKVHLTIRDKSKWSKYDHLRPLTTYPTHYFRSATHMYRYAYCVNYFFMSCTNFKWIVYRISEPEIGLLRMWADFDVLDFFVLILLPSWFASPVVPLSGIKSF